MSQEQLFDLIGWWNEQSFSGKEFYKFQESGEIILLPGTYISERTIATISAENAATVIKTLVEKFSAVESRVHDLTVEWQTTEDKLKLADKVNNLKEYLQHVSALGDYTLMFALVHDWQHTIYALTEENYAVKLKLTEQAEELANSDQWKETTQALRDIADKWKATGYVDKNRNDKLWARIEVARKTFSDRKKKHHDDEEKDMLSNLDLKIDLVEQAESIAASEEWKKTTDAFHRLTEEWKTIGHTLNKKNEELWHRFLAAKSAFFERKREHSSRIQVEHEANMAVKLAIVEKAEEIKDGTDWNATTQAFATLMEEWKKSGRVPNEKGEELWKRFSEAQDVFYENKKQHFDAQRAVLDQNYNLKKAIFDRAQVVKNSNHWSDATAEMIDLLEQWKKIGPIHRSHGDKMWEEFNAARKHFFARKDANRDQRKQFYESQKAVRAQEAIDMIENLKKEIKEEEENLVEFKNAIGNITPGKKAEELRSHLEKLINDGGHKIKKLQDRYKQALKDIEAGKEEAKEPAASTTETN